MHVNRVLQELRKEGLIRFQGDALTILDWERLKTMMSSLDLSQPSERGPVGLVNG